MRYAKYSKDYNNYETARQNAYYDEKDDGTLVTCGRAIDKLGEYENIDESPEYLAKVKQAFEIIKKKKVDVTRFVFAIKRDDLSYYNYYCYELITKEEWDLLGEVLL